MENLTGAIKAKRDVFIIIIPRSLSHRRISHIMPSQIAFVVIVACLATAHCQLIGIKVDLAENDVHRIASDGINGRTGEGLGRTVGETAGHVTHIVGHTVDNTVNAVAGSKGDTVGKVVRIVDSTVEHKVPAAVDELVGNGIGTDVVNGPGVVGKVVDKVPVIVNKALGPTIL